MWYREKVSRERAGFQTMAKNTFVVNKVSYVAKPFDFDMICELEDMGVTFERIDKMPMSLIRAYFAVCAGVPKEQAALLIQNHLINGGKLEDLTEPMAKEMNDSDFFRALSEKEEQTSTENKRKKRESNEE
jgi:hypothetical protein